MSPVDILKKEYCVTVTSKWKPTSIPSNISTLFTHIKKTLKVAEDKVKANMAKKIAKSKKTPDGGDTPPTVPPKGSVAPRGGHAVVRGRGGRGRGRGAGRGGGGTVLAATPQARSAAPASVDSRMRGKPIGRGHSRSQVPKEKM